MIDDTDGFSLRVIIIGNTDLFIMNQAYTSHEISILKS